MLLGYIEELIYFLLILLLGSHNTDDSSIQLYLINSADGSLIPMNSTDSSKLDMQKDTIFIVHGFTESSDFILYPFLYKALIGNGTNIISVDWSVLAKGPNYFAAVENVNVVGKFVANYIINHNLDPSKVHIIGFSLGAHVAGIVGKLVKAALGLIRRIIGLDPAGPMYGYSDEIPEYRRLSPGDAQMVTTLHTNRYLFGTRFPSGKVNFIANKGTFQPGCTTETLLDYLVCCHRRAVVYCTESVHSDRFVGTSLQGAKLTFGNNILDTDSGTYYFDTNAQAPYARG